MSSVFYEDNTPGSIHAGEHPYIWHADNLSGRVFHGDKLPGELRHLNYKIFMSGFWEENRRLLFTAAAGPVSYLSGGVQW